MTTSSTKVTAATAATALALIIFWVLERWVVADIPAAVEGAGAIVLVWVVGYVTPERNPSPSARARIRELG